MPYDIAILGDSPQGSSLLNFQNTIVNGGYKLVQTVMLLLFTDEDAEFSAGLGTQLPSLIGQTNNHDEGELKNQFDIAASKVQDTLAQSQPLDLPDNEKLKQIDVEVSRTQQTADQAVVEITVISQDDTATTVNMPITLSQV